jgi:hypothetical protein
VIDLLVSLAWRVPDVLLQLHLLDHDRMSRFWFLRGTVGPNRFGHDPVALAGAPPGTPPEPVGTAPGPG